MPAKLQIMQSESLINKIINHFESNKENMKPEDAENLLDGENGFNFVAGYLRDLNKISEINYKTDNEGRYEYFSDIQKTYYKNSFESVLRNLGRFKKAYAKTSTSQELLAYIEVLEVRVRDDLNVIKQINLEKDHSLAEAVEKYTEYPNGYSYKDHMAKMKRSVKRSRELNELSKGAAEGSAIKQLSDKIKTLKESGAAITSDEAKGLINLYADAAIELKDGLEKDKKNVEKAEMYKKMIKKFSKDYTALHKYKNRIDKAENPKLMSIDEFFDASRTRVIKLHDTEMTELDKSGAGQNVRYKIDFKLEDEPVDGASKGDIVTGYFTADKVYDPDKKTKSMYSTMKSDEMISDDAHKDIIDYLIAKYPDETEFINSFKDNADINAYMGTKEKYDQKFVLNGDEMCVADDIETTVFNMMSDYNKCPKATATGAKVIQEIGNNETRLNAYVEYTGMYMKQHFADMLNRKNGINLKAAQGKRNALASAIADVFGVSDVLAFSEKVKVEALENGKKVVKTGVMMMPAKGLDSAGVGADSEFYNFSKMGLEQNPGLVKNIAALQLIDYIIMNTDRHNSNYFYQFDKDGRLVAVQGIDNDTSCGSKENAHAINFGTAFKNLRVIPKSMADIAKELKPEAFEVLLQGYDLDKDEIKNMVNVFTDLKEKINKCEKAYEGTEPGFLVKDTPRIVPDNEWNKYYVNEQLVHLDPATKGKGSNLFGMLTYAIGDRFKPISRTVTNNSRKCARLATELVRTRLDKSPGSLYDSLKGFKKVTGAYDKKNASKEGTFENVISKTEAIFDPKKKNMRFITDNGYIKVKADNGEYYCGETVYAEKSELKSYAKTLKSALKAANAYLQENSELVMDYQMCKAEIDMYKKEGNAEKLKVAQGELKLLEKNPDVQKYKMAVKIRDKVTEQLEKTEKLSKTVKELDQTVDMYYKLQNTIHTGANDYENSDFRKMAKENIRRLESRNKLKDPNAPAVQGQALGQIETKKIHVKRN